MRRKSGVDPVSTMATTQQPLPRILLLLVLQVSGTLVMAETYDHTENQTQDTRQYPSPHPLGPSAGAPRVPTASGGYLNLDLEMRNITKYSGETVRIKCEITGEPLPNYSWTKDAESLDEISRLDKRFQVKTTAWGSRLKINNLGPDDSGTFVCEGINRHGVKQTSGSLTVLPGENPKKTERKKEDERPGEFDYDNYEIPELDQHAGDTNYYDNPGRPNRERYPLNPGPGSEFLGDFDGEARCQPYRGAACSKFLSNKSIFVRSSYQQGAVEEKLMAAVAVVSGSVSKMSDTCSRLAMESLCYSFLPLCADTPAGPRERQVCRSECVALTRDLCASDYRAMIQDNAKFEGPYTMPDCSQLPEDGTPEGADCVSLGVVAKVSSRHPCYNDSGTTYRGNESRTKSGKKCKSWSDMGQNYQNYPELGGHNYCRNPGNTESGPWCYTSDIDMPKELCSIPQCPVIGEKNSLELLFILGPCIAVPIVLALILTLICLCQRKKQNNSQHKPLAQAPNQVEMNAMLAKKAPLKARDFPIGNVHFLQELGESSYGKVYRGELIGYYGDSSVTPVAIKMLRDGSPSKQQQDFRQEVETITDFKHPNLVCLMGVCLSQQQMPVCMLFDYMVEGDLHQFLSMHSPRSDMAGSDDEGHVLDNTDMLHITTQVAAGMEYLTCHNYVHKDLAARNVLVCSKMQVKVTDLGLSRGMYSSDYYHLQNQSLLPVRWMPPEALMYNKFSVESDVWSFGVLLWEVYSYGLQPYYGYSNQEVIQMIRARQILPNPEDCPSRLYALMVECWHETAMRRPTFKEVHQRLCQWKGEAVVANHQGFLLGVAHSASGHSSSTHHSGQSAGPVSHHSSTGPSNNTASTGLNSSGGAPQPANGGMTCSVPINGGIHHGINAMQPNIMHNHTHTHIPNGLPYYVAPHAQTQHVPIPIPPPPSGPNYAPKQPPQYTHLYKKPSPPGSVTSHQSSMQSSPASSISNYKPNVHNQNAINSGMNNQRYGNMHSPTSAQNMVNNFKLPTSTPTSNDIYIPDTRTSDI